jgi:hypothetical protein
MSDGKLELKHPTGWFAAGVEMKQALAVLSDGAFKLYVHLCLHADRRTAQLRFRLAELAQATGHSVRSVTTYLEQLRLQEVCIVFTASNQHEHGRIEINDRFWPYRKQTESSAASNPEQALYLARVRDLFLSPACVAASFAAADEKLAAQWYGDGVLLEIVERAILLGCARKYIALSNHPEASPITSLHYFAGLIEEVTNTEVGMDYWRFLAARVKKMEAHCRAHAKFAAATALPAKETK